MAHSVNIKAVGDALVSYLSSNLTSLGLVSCSWVAGMRSEPVYPANPRTDCPLLRLRLYTADLAPGTVKQSTDVTVQASLYYYRRQTAGQAHQTLLLSALETIAELFTGDWRPSGIEALPGIALYSVVPRQMVIHDEMPHPLGDDPAMRVSVGELVLAITYRSNA